MQRPRGLRYDGKMRKSIRKLVVRREIVRALHVLDHKDLARAHGGTGSVAPCAIPQAASGNVYCPAPAAVPTAAGG
jgi:hypothetical protein